MKDLFDVTSKEGKLLFAAICNLQSGTKDLMGKPAEEIIRKISSYYGKF